MLPLVSHQEKEIRPYLHGEHSYGPYSNHWLSSPEDKFIWYSETGTEQYFRTEEDPKELKDEIGNPAYASRISYLRSELVNMLKDSPEGFSNGKTLIPGRPYPPYLPQDGLDM